MLQTGSMITMDYTASIVEDGNSKVFDTTIMDIATTETIYKPDKIYEPMLVVLGEGWIPKGLDTILIKSSIGDTLDVLIPCNEAYGPKDPSKIKLVARREFQKLNINPSIGDRITIGTQLGTVLSVSSTRVRMDYNHVLAGKDINYKINVHQLIEGDENKIKYLIKRRLPGTVSKNIKVEIEGEYISIYMPEHTRYYEYIQFAKAEVAKDVKDIISTYKGINFIDFFSCEE